MEISEVQSVEDQYRNWKHATKMLPKAPDSDFLVSPGDVKEVRKCVQPKNDISDETRESFRQLLDKYQAAFSSCCEDIGHTELITMDIDTGLSQPVSQRPYTLPLKHRDFGSTTLDVELRFVMKNGILVRCCWSRLFFLLLGEAGVFIGSILFISTFSVVLGESGEFSR